MIAGVRANPVPAFRRRFLQFSLSTLLLLTFAAALWVNFYLMPLKRKHDAVQALRELGATMSFANMSEGNWDDTPEIQGPSLLRWLLGDEYFAEEPATINLRITHRAVTDSDLAQLRYLERLEMLIVDFEKTSRSSSNPPSGIRIPAWLTGEEDLGLPPTVIVKIGCKEVTDEGLAYISHLRNLQWLDLCGTSVTDAGLEHLPNIKKLERLTLRGSLVTEVGIEELQRAMPKLQIYHEAAR